MGGFESAGCEGGEGRGGGEVSYLIGDSFSRNSRRLGSRLRRGSLFVVDGVLLSPNHPENQPIEVHTPARSLFCSSLPGSSVVLFEDEDRLK